MSGHGKTLEMKAIKIPPPVHLCVCGLSWPAHLTKKGDRRLKKYEGDEHHIAGASLNEHNLQLIRDEIAKQSKAKLKKLLVTSTRGGI